MHSFKEEMIGYHNQPQLWVCMNSILDVILYCVYIHNLLGQQQSAYDNHKVPQKPSPTLQCHDQGQDSPQSSNKLSSSPQGLSRPPSQFQFAEMVIAKISSKWRRFGFLLEITSNELDTIQAGHAGVSPSDCFIDVFSLWQQTERRPFQWHTVVNILNTNSISEQRLAQVITDKFV